MVHSCPLRNQAFPLLLGKSPGLWVWEVLSLVKVCKAYKMAATACLLTQSVGSLLQLLKGILPQHLGKPQHPAERE